MCWRRSRRPAEAPPLASTDEYQAPSLARAEWEHINWVLADCGGNISEAARRLGLHRRSLQRKLQKYPPAD
ncbi:MAG: helix-turn-helix domain-containing protein [bacterium]